jgi:hypothetical protein
MNLLAITVRGMSMSMQQRLFEDPPPAWIARLWETINPERREEVLTILAEMGRSAIDARRSSIGEGDDES